MDNDSARTKCNRYTGPLAVVAITVTILVLCSILIYPNLNAKWPSSGTCLQAVQLLFAIMAMGFLLLVNCTDPGTVAKDSALAAGLDSDDTPPPEQRVRGTMHFFTAPDGSQIEYRWCDSCGLWKPPRASHCGICRRCFDRFDHHCPWVGNCVARGNHRFFCGFTGFIGVAGLCVPLALAMTICTLDDHPENSDDWTGPMWGLAVLAACGLCWFGSCAFQGVCQLVMLFLDLTTKEMVGARAGASPPTDCADLQARCKTGPRAVCCAPWEPRQH